MLAKFPVRYMALCGIIWLVVEVSSNSVYQFPNDADVPIGANFTMFCKFPISQGTISVFWWREGMRTSLEPDTRKQFNVGSGRGTFVLHNVNVADSGIYYCQAKHQNQHIGNGSGCQLTVFDSPTPLKIVSLEESLAAPKLVCKTDAFYPETLEIFWRKNNVEILTGIETVKYRNADRLYEASSFLEIAQPARGQDVYTCLVSHISLKVPASFTYIVEPDPNSIILILTCAQGGLAIIALLIIFAELVYKPLNVCSKTWSSIVSDPHAIDPTRRTSNTRDSSRTMAPDV